MSEHTHAYIGKLPCGCAIAACVDMADKHTGETVAEFIQDGLVISRIPLSELHSGATLIKRNCAECNPPAAEQMTLLEGGAA